MDNVVIIITKLIGLLKQNIKAWTPLTKCAWNPLKDGNPWMITTCYLCTNDVMLHLVHHGDTVTTNDTL